MPTKLELFKEREKILRILKKRGHKDPKVEGNYITDYPDTDTELTEREDEVYESEQYDVNLDIEHVLEKRLQKIEEELKKIDAK